MPFSACTNTITDTLDWCAAFILQRPSSGVGGFTNEPGLTNANLIASTILSPPFSWQWNRATTSFVTTAGTSDYSVALTTFGYLEKATVNGSGLTPPMNPPIQEIQIKPLLATSGKNNRPTFISVVNDDNAGNITFRLMPIPDQAYTIELTYQNAPVIITSLTQTWAPIPDKYNFLYERAMLAMLHGMYDSTTYLQEMELFLRQLVGVSEGLDDAAKAIFLADRLELMRTQVLAQSATTATVKKAM